MADILNALEGEKLYLRTCDAKWIGPAEYCFSPNWYRITQGQFYDWFPCDERQDFLIRLTNLMMKAKEERDGNEGLGTRPIFLRPLWRD